MEESIKRDEEIVSSPAEIHKKPWAKFFRHLTRIALNRWDGRSETLRPSLWIQKPLPEPLPDILPVVCLGELHKAPTHVGIELEALRELRPLGYDTVEIEYSRDMEAAGQRYAASSHAESDYREFIRTKLELEWGKVFTNAPTKKQEEAISQSMLDPQDQIGRSLLDGAGTLGYRIRFADLPMEQIQEVLDNQRFLKTIGVRNAAFACVIAEEAKNGHGVVAVHGTQHLSEIVPGTSLKIELARQCVPSRTFDLALDGRRPAEKVYQALRRAPKPVDHVVGDGASVGKIMRGELTGREN